MSTRRHRDVPGRPAMVLLAALVTAACTGDLPSVTPTCDNAPAMQLIAQAVPEAERIPCFTRIPFGYDATTFNVGSSLADLRLSHKVIGRDAILLTLAASCTNASGQATDHSTTDATELKATPNDGLAGEILFDVGACLLVEVRLDHPDGRRALDDFTSSLQLLERSQIPTGEGPTGQ